MSHWALSSILLVILLSSCGSSLRTVINSSQPELPLSAEVILLEVGSSIPDSAIYIGQIEIYDKRKGKKLCNYNHGIQTMKFETLKSGGNTLRIVQHSPPNGESGGCHQFKAEMYFVKSGNELVMPLNQKVDTALIVNRDEEHYARPEFSLDDRGPGNNIEWPYKKFRIGIGAGYGILTAKDPEGLPPFLNDYVKELRSGANIRMDAHVFVSRIAAFGIRYSVFHTENSIYPVQFIDSQGNSTIGEIKDDIRTSFIGLSVMARLPSESRTSLLLGLAIGNIVYENNGVVIEEIRITGNEFGAEFLTGLDVQLNETMALGLEMSLLAGALNSLDIEYGQGIKETVNLLESEKESMGRFDMSLGLRVLL